MRAIGVSMFSDVGIGVAARDIQAGEEPNCDYRDFTAGVSHVDCV